LLGTIQAMAANTPQLTGKELDEYAAKDFAQNDWSHPHPAAATLDDVVAHIDHVAKMAGIDHVGIGSDFDGIPNVPKGLEDASKMPALVATLLRHGYSETDIRKIMGGNTLRVMKAAIGE
jgi:membrane dipeptidase